LFYRDGLGDFYTVTSVERFDHAGVRGAVVSGQSRACNPELGGRPADADLHVLHPQGPEQDRLRGTSVGLRGAPRWI
jgi:hypothetical protein